MKKLLTVLLTVLIAFTTLTFNVAALETDVEAKKDDVTEVEQEDKLDVIEEEEMSLIEEEKGKEIIEPEVPSKEDDIKLDKDPLKETALKGIVSVSAPAEMVTDTYELVEYGDTIDTDGIYVVATKNIGTAQSPSVKYMGFSTSKATATDAKYENGKIVITHDKTDDSFEMKLVLLNGSNYQLTHNSNGEKYISFFASSIFKFTTSSSQSIYVDSNNYIRYNTNTTNQHLYYDLDYSYCWSVNTSGDSKGYAQLYKKIVEKQVIATPVTNLEYDGNSKALTSLVEVKAGDTAITPTTYYTVALLDSTDTSVTDAGEYDIKITLTTAGKAKYYFLDDEGAHVDNVTVKATIAKAESTATAKKNSFEYTGDNLLDTIKANIEVTDTSHYSIDLYKADDETKALETVKDVGDYKAVITLSDTNFGFGTSRDDSCSLNIAVTSKVISVGPKLKDSIDLIYNKQNQVLTSSDFDDFDGKIMKLVDGTWTGKNANKYIGKISLASGYVWDYSSLDLDEDGNLNVGWEIKPAPVKVTSKDAKYINGEYHYSYDGKEYIPEFVFSSDIDKDLIPSKDEYSLHIDGVTRLINAGSVNGYTITLEDKTGNKNYCFSGDTANKHGYSYVIGFKFVVDQAQATLSFKDTPYDYNEDGVKPGNEDIVISYKDRYSKDITVSGKDIVKVDNTYYTEKGEIANPPKEPGNYYVAAELPKDNNFFIDVKESKPIYSQEKVTFTINKKAIVITTSIDSVTYNGRQQRPTITFRDESGNVVRLKEKDWFSGDYTVSYRNNVNAGTAIATITLANEEYVFDGDSTRTTVTFKINPRVTNASITNIDKQYSIEYSGRQFVPNFNFTNIVEWNWTKNRDYTVKFYEGHIKDTVTEHREVRPEDVKDAGDYSAVIELKNQNYCFETFGPVTIEPLRKLIINFTITKATLTASLIIPRDGYTYDGEAKEPRVLLTGFKYRDEWLHGNEYSVVYNFYGNSIDAGDKHAYVHLTDSLAKNYTLVGGKTTKYGNIDLPYKINPKPLIVIWPEAEKFEYNGQKQPIPEIIKGGIVTKDLGRVHLDTEVSKKVFNKYVPAKESVDVGSYKATAILTGDRANNYVLVDSKANPLTKTYEITPKLVKIVWSGLGPYVYDGKVHGPSYQFVDPKDDTPFELYKRDNLVYVQFDIPVDEKPDSLEELMKYNGAAWQNVDAGKYVSIVLLAGEKETNYTFTGCNWGEALPGLVGFDVDFEILPRELHIEWDSKTKFVKNGKPHVPSFKVVSATNDPEDDTAIVKRDEGTVYVDYIEGYGAKTNKGNYTAKLDVFSKNEYRNPTSNYVIKEGEDIKDFKIYTKPNEDTTPVKTGVDR